MSRIITLITALGAAVMLAVPAAWGAPEPDAWSDGMNRLYGLGEYSPEARAEQLRSEGLNKLYGLGEYSPAVRAEKLRSEGLNKLYGLGEWSTTTPTSIEVRERGMSVGREDPTISMLDTREQAFGAKRDAQFSIATMPDVFERTVGARETGSGDHFVANDDRVQPVDRPVQVTVTGSGDEVAWPQVGIGFGIGMALILGLVLALRATRQRPFAH